MRIVTSLIIGCMTVACAKALALDSPAALEALAQDEEREIAERIEEREREIHELFREADRLEKEGRPHEANRIREQAEEMAAEMERWTREIEERRIARAKRHLDELLSLAHRAEEQGDIDHAKMLRLEAEEVKRWLGGAREERERNRKVAAVEQEIGALMERAEDLEREGRFEEAVRLRRKVEEQRLELDWHLREMEYERFAEAQRRIERLHTMARAAKQQGDLHRARECLAEAQDLARMLEHERARREFEAGIEEMNRNIHKLLGAADDAEHDGDPARADELRRKAHELESERQRTIDEFEKHERKLEVEHLREIARREREAGNDAAADDALRRIHDLEREHREQPRRPEMSREEKLAGEIAELREEIRLLREEVQRLNRKLPQAGDRPKRDLQIF